MRGDFGIWLTASDWSPPESGREVAEFAARAAVKFSHIMLDGGRDTVLSRGRRVSQPMLSVRTTGTVDEARQLAEDWRSRAEAAGLIINRTKIRVATPNEGMPVTDVDAEQGADAGPDGSVNYFEHHVKVRLPGGDVPSLLALRDLIEAHGARTSCNAARPAGVDGREERFVTQRCRRVGRRTASARLDALLADLRSAGFDLAEVEQWYVVADDCLGMDTKWLEYRDSPVFRRPLPTGAGSAGGAGFPPTYQPLPRQAGITQRPVFDPALKQFPYAYKAGDPVFDDPDTTRRWRAARRAAMDHVLATLVGSSLGRRLVLRGSVPLRSWLGPAAREPGDLDFVVLPRPVNRRRAARFVATAKAALARRPGAGLAVDRIVVEDIWTYDRAFGRRLVVPFQVDGLPTGTVQIDVVFNEHLPVPPVRTVLPPSGIQVLTAPPELALAWKLLWLSTDMWPQAKDLYDATLLAEHVRIAAGLIRTVVGPHFTTEDVLAWEFDWDNLRAEHPDLPDDAEQWQRRLASTR